MSDAFMSVTDLGRRFRDEDEPERTTATYRARGIEAAQSAGVPLIPIRGRLYVLRAEVDRIGRVTP